MILSIIGTLVILCFGYMLCSMLNLFNPKQFIIWCIIVIASVLGIGAIWL